MEKIMNPKTFISCLDVMYLHVPKYLSCLLSTVLIQGAATSSSTKSSNCSHILPPCKSVFAEIFVWNNPTDCILSVCLMYHSLKLLVKTPELEVSSTTKNVIKFASVEFYLTQRNKHNRDSCKTILRAFKILLYFKGHKLFALTKSLRYWALISV